MLEGHGVQLESGIACDPCSAGEVSKRYVRIPNGEERVVCPLCIQQFQPDDSEGLYAHLAQEHGRLITSSRVNDVQFQGQSEHLDLLYANPSKHWFPRRDDVAERLHVVSLGCYCGIKTSLQHMGLGHAHLPFDWMRTTSAGVAHFVRNHFQGYFTCKLELDVPDSNLKMQRLGRRLWQAGIVAMTIPCMLTVPAMLCLLQHSEQLQHDYRLEPNKQTRHTVLSEKEACGRFTGINELVVSGKILEMPSEQQRERLCLCLTYFSLFLPGQATPGALLGSAKIHACGSQASSTRFSE